MKYLPLFLLLTHAGWSQIIPKSFQLKGHILNADTLKQVTLILNNGSGKSQTVELINGKFVFTGHLDYPCLALVESSSFSSGIGVWLSNDTIEADFQLVPQGNTTYRLQTTRVSGSTDAQDYLYHIQSFLPLYRQKQYQTITDQIRAYVNLHRQSYYSVHLISTYLEPLGASTAKELLASLTPAAKQSLEATSLKLRIKTAEQNRIGKPIANLALRDDKNQSKQLSSLLKPYTLIHVWASWCKPCREHSPQLVALHQRVDPNQVQLIGISVDTNLQAWRNAIGKDKLSWVQLSDPHDFKGEVAREFAISSIPYVLLVDQKATILATTLDDALKMIPKN
jgi:thiol-disulfide isomerase/thioredoxin